VYDDDNIVVFGPTYGEKRKPPGQRSTGGEGGVGYDFRFDYSTGEQKAKTVAASGKTKTRNTAVLGTRLTDGTLGSLNGYCVAAADGNPVGDVAVKVPARVTRIIIYARNKTFHGHVRGESIGVAPPQPLIDASGTLGFKGPKVALRIRSPPTEYFRKYTNARTDLRVVTGD